MERTVPMHAAQSEAGARGGPAIAPAHTALRADVYLGSGNRSRGYGTVLLATAEDAGRAVDMRIPGRHASSRYAQTECATLTSRFPTPRKNTRRWGAISS
ncbi:hypothetical protein B0H11DRAFT_2030740 [Mycena galericulata]|nr:hypothetical protein B0H11DRAFT_2030740 [Mycena galericulata]